MSSGPELVAEVASSSVNIDLTTKFRIYRRNGVREYLVWRCWTRPSTGSRCVESQYDRLQPGDDGLYRSEVFPGLWLDVAR